MEVGNAFLKKGYRIKIFNTINFKKSMRYNPFHYIHSEKDILKLVTTLMTNTRGEGKGGDPFWDKAEKLLLTSLIAYIHYEAPVEEQNFATLLEFLNIMEVREDDEEFQNPVDLMFEDLAKEKPDHFAVRQYRLYKLAAGKTAKSILISCGARLAAFDIAELREITAYDELELDTLGAVPHHVGHRQHLQFPDLDGVHPVVQPALREGRRCVRRATARPCAMPHRRVRQHRADPEPRKASSYHPQPGNFCLPGLAGAKPAQGAV